MSLSDFVHRFVAAEQPGAPTLLVLHGTGGDENDLLALARMLRPGAAVLSPRGRVLEQGMPRFFRRLAEGVFDQEDLARRTIELDAFVAEAAGTYRFDPRAVVAVGYSNGANIAPACCSRVRARWRPPCCSERWCRSSRRRCRIWPAAPSCCRRGKRIPSSRRP